MTSAPLTTAAPPQLTPIGPDEAYALAHRHFQQGQLDAAIALLDAILRHHPQHAASLGLRAALHLQAQQPQAAEQLLRQALAAGIDTAVLWCNLGTALSDQGRTAEAAQAYHTATQRDPGMALPWYNLGNLLRDQERLSEAAAAYRQALACGPEPRFWNNLGNVLASQGAYAEAGEAYAQAIAAASSNPAEQATAIASRGNLEAAQGDYRAAEADLRQAAGQLPDPVKASSARFNLALTLLRQGRYEEAFPLYEHRWQGCPSLAGQYRYPVERQWRGEILHGQRLLLWCEQGLGDSLQFIRFLSAVQARQPARLALLVPPALHRLFAHACPELELIPREQAPNPEQFASAWDYHCPLMSLWLALAAPALPQLAATPAPVPYLHAPTLPAMQLPPAPPDEIRLGLCWRSGPGAEQRERSLPLAELAAGLAPLAAQSAAAGIRLRWVSLLQPRPNRPPEAAPLAWQISGDWLDLMPACTDLADTAALMAQLDAVITVDTGPLHLAGALGLPTYGLFPAVGGNFFPHGRSDSPWYPTLRLIRQPARGDWAGALAQLCVQLNLDLIAPLR